MYKPFIMKAYVDKLIGNLVKESSLILAEHFMELRRYDRILDTPTEIFNLLPLYRDSCWSG